MMDRYGRYDQLLTEEQTKAKAFESKLSGVRRQLEDVKVLAHK